MPVDSPFAALLAQIAVAPATVSVLGSETAYWTYGDADAPVTLVFVHGYRGEHHGLEPVIAQLRDVRIIAPDLPAYGRSTPMTEAGHGIPGFAAWLGAFVSALGLQDAVILGHSFGSIIVAHAASEGLIEPPKLILINPIASTNTSGFNAALMRGAIGGMKLAGRLPRTIGRWAIGSWPFVQVMSNVMTTTKNTQLRRWIHGQHHAYFSDFASMGTVVEGFEASVTRTVVEVAASVSIPTLLIGAELDPITPVADVERLHTLMPDATLRMIPEVGHLIHYEKSREAAGFIVEFIGSGHLPELG